MRLKKHQVYTIYQKKIVVASILSESESVYNLLYGNVQMFRVKSEASKSKKQVLERLNL